MPVEVLILLALAFAVVTGMNDGGSLLAPGLRVPGLSLPIAIGLLTVAAAALPLITGAPVAQTLAETIVAPGPGSALALVIGFGTAVAVIWVLTTRGLPTSLTLGVIGGTAGAGWGAGTAISWDRLGWVLLIAALAPVVGMILALAGASLWHPGRPRRYLSAMRRGHIVAFTAQCVAYGANDGQKMLVLLLAAGLAHPSGRLDWWWYPILGLAFAIGTLLGLPKLARAVGTGILGTRPAHVVTGEFAAAGAVLGSAALGAPVSMTQAIVGGLLGAGLRESYLRIRWRAVRGLVLAWALTLPTSFGIAALAGTVVRALGA